MGDYNPNSSSFVVAKSFRPPNASVGTFDKIERLIKLVKDENKELYLTRIKIRAVLEFADT